MAIATADECAQEILEVVPLVMRAIRAEMRSFRTPELTVPQFRTLAFLKHHSGASLSDAAEHIGLALPSMSKMIDGLVNRQMVNRDLSPYDRRYVTLALTELGQTTLQMAFDATQARLSELLATLPPAQRETISQAMQFLRPVFSLGPAMDVDP